MSQSHFTLGFPLKSPADTKALADQLAVDDARAVPGGRPIGTIHYYAFTVLSEGPCCSSATSTANSVSS